MSGLVVSHVPGAAFAVRMMGVMVLTTAMATVAMATAATVCIDQLRTRNSNHKGRCGNQENPFFRHGFFLFRSNSVLPTSPNEMSMTKPASPKARRVLHQLPAVPPDRSAGNTSPAKPVRACSTASSA
jgi:hypothetical protein